jgi:hypothetical protein
VRRHIVPIPVDFTDLARFPPEAHERIGPYRSKGRLATVSALSRRHCQRQVSWQLARASISRCSSQKPRSDELCGIPPTDEEAMADWSATDTLLQDRLNGPLNLIVGELLTPPSLTLPYGVPQGSG